MSVLYLIVKNYYSENIKVVYNSIIPITHRRFALFNGEIYPTRKGVIVWRESINYERLWTTLFLEGEGIVTVSSKNMPPCGFLAWGQNYCGDVQFQRWQ